MVVSVKPLGSIPSTHGAFQHNTLTLGDQLGLLCESFGYVEGTVLEKYGREVTRSEIAITDDSLPVVLVNNFAFTAAGIAYNEGEVRAFTDPSDGRPKRYFMVPRENLAEFMT